MGGSMVLRVRKIIGGKKKDLILGFGDQGTLHDIWGRKKWCSIKNPSDKWLKMTLQEKNNLFLDEGIFCPLDVHTRKLNMLEAPKHWRLPGVYGRFSYPGPCHLKTGVMKEDTNPNQGTYFFGKRQNSRHPVCHIPSLTLTLAPENGWLELLLFLVGRPIFRDYVSFEGKVFHTICMNFNFSHTWVPSSKLTGRCNDSISPLFET